MRVDVVHTLAAVDRATWNLLARDAGLYSSHEWLAAVAAGTHGRCRYLLAYDGDRLAGALPVYLVASEPNPHYSPRLVFRDLPPGGAGPECLAGGRSGYRSEPLLAEGLSEAERISVVGSLLSALSALARDEGCTHAAFLYLTGRGLRWIMANTEGVSPLLSYSGDAWLEAAGSCFSDYLAALPRKRRWTALNEMRQFTANGLHVSVEDPRDHLDTVARLVANVDRKYDRDVSVDELVHKLQRQCDALGRQVILFMCRSSTDVLGVTVAYAWGNRLYIGMAGFDYQLLRDAYEYFNVVIYEPMKYCYDAGLAGIHLGTGSHQAKALRGARISPLASVALPADAARYGDPATRTARMGVRRYWLQQLAAMPRYFDSAEWEPLLGAVPDRSEAAHPG